MENEYEAARREAAERMRAEEESRQLQDKLQAEALRQQMEELKQREMEVRVGLPGPRQPFCHRLWKRVHLRGRSERF